MIPPSPGAPALLTRRRLFRRLVDFGRRLRSAVTLLAIAASCTAGAGADPLDGLWTGQRHLGPQVGGPLTVWRDGDVWSAEIAGRRASVHVDTGKLRFELPAGQGSFRGRLLEDGKEIVGHWIQPPTATLNTPYASPIRLHRSGEIWRGEVRPLEDRIHLHLFFHRHEENAERRQVVVRNPERNLGLFLRVEEVRLDKDRVALVDSDDQPVAEGRLRDGTLSLHFSGAGQTFDFRRVERRDDRGFYPTPAEETYRYRAPTPRGDGWAVAHATESGVDAQRLAALVRHIRETPTRSVRAPYPHSLLVAHRGKLILEEYFHGHDAATPHDTRSAGKSLASMLAGMAMDRHPELDAETTMTSVFGAAAAEPLPDLASPSFEKRAAWRRQMTLGHLLSMSSGLACNDDDDDSPGGEDRMQNQSAQPDWVRYILEVPMARQPGTGAFYCSNSINLALATVSRAIDRWLPEAFAEWVAEPLEIERYHFNLTPVGDGYMGGGIRLRSRDQLKLGQVMLDGGMWRGRRVLSESWVEQSLAAHAGIHEDADYGYGWWNTVLTNPATGRDHRAFFASGNGGQLVIGIPDLDLAVQVSGGNYSNFPVWIRFLREWVPQHILPAVASDAAEAAPADGEGDGRGGQ